MLSPTWAREDVELRGGWREARLVRFFGSFLVCWVHSLLLFCGGTGFWALGLSRYNGMIGDVIFLVLRRFGEVGARVSRCFHGESIIVYRMTSTFVEEAKREWQ